MVYGKDCSAGSYVNGKWVDSRLPWHFHLPKVQASLYPDGDDVWYLLEDYYFRIGDEVILIKAGFDWDGASIPRACWTIVGHPMGVRKQIAGCIHDALYASNIKGRHVSDDIFLGVLKVCGNNWLVRNECWSAVRSFGGFVYPKTKEELRKYQDMVYVLPINK
jgi:hypothetical protein